MSHSQHGLIKMHKKFAINIAEKWFSRFGRSIPRDDLRQAALLGLVQAAKSFDHELGISFLGYAFKRINGAVLDEISFVVNKPELKNVIISEDSVIFIKSQTFDSDESDMPTLGAIHSSFDIIESHIEFDQLTRKCEPREKAILWALYQGKNQAEVADDFKITQGRLSQILSRLRSSMM